jgi:hypothetical protein
MKKCPIALISSFLSKGTIGLVILLTVFTKPAYSQQIFKFEKLPLEVQNSIINNLEKRLSVIDTVKEIFISDTVTVHDPEKNFKTLFNYHINAFHRDSSSGTDTLINLTIRCTSFPFTIGNSNVKDKDEAARYWSSGSTDPRYITIAKLSFACNDHTPHHSATTLKEMMKLQAKYHCKKIKPLILE